MGILHRDNKNKIHENEEAEMYNCGVMVYGDGCAWVIIMYERVRVLRNVYSRMCLQS